MFNFLKRTPEKVETDQTATILRLQEEAQAMKVVIQRLAQRVAEHSLDIENLNCDVQRIDQFGEAIAEYGTDGSLELKKHECQLAGLWSWRAAVIDDLKDIRAKL